MGREVSLVKESWMRLVGAGRKETSRVGGSSGLGENLFCVTVADQALSRGGGWHCFSTLLKVVKDFSEGTLSVVLPGLI